MSERKQKLIFVVADENLTDELEALKAKATYWDEDTISESTPTGFVTSKIKLLGIKSKSSAWVRSLWVKNEGSVLPIDIQKPIVRKKNVVVKKKLVTGK